MLRPLKKLSIFLKRLKLKKTKKTRRQLKLRRLRKLLRHRVTTMMKTSH